MGMNHERTNRDAALGPVAGSGSWVQSPSVTVSRYWATCAACGNRIRPGQRIQKFYSELGKAKSSSGWAHAPDCRNPATGRKPTPKPKLCQVCNRPTNQHSIRQRRACEQGVS